MSVWKDPCYRIEPILALSKIINMEDLFEMNGLWNFKIDPMLEFAPTGAPEIMRDGGCVADWLKSNVDDLKRRKLITAMLPKYNWRVKEIWKDLDITALKKVTSWSAGIKGVYSMVEHFYKGNIAVDPGNAARDAWDPMLEILRIQKYTTLGHESTMDSFTDLLHLPSETHRLLAQSVGIFKILSNRRSGDYRQAMGKRGEKVVVAMNPTMWRDESTYLQQTKWSVYAIGDVVIFTNDLSSMAHDVINGYVMTKKDINRIAHILRGLALSRFYASNYAEYWSVMYGVDSSSVMGPYNKIEQMLLDTMAASDYDTANDVCAAFAVAHDIYLATIAECKVVDSTSILIDKFYEKGLDKLVNYKYILSIMDDLPVTVAMDLTSLYKCLPCPDFCHYSALRKQHEAHNKKNPLGKQSSTKFLNTKHHHRYNSRIEAYRGMKWEDSDIHINSENAWRDLEKVAIYTLLESTKKSRGYWPGVVKTEYASEPWVTTYREDGLKTWRDVHKIDYRGSGTYVMRGADGVLLAKDKTIAPCNAHICESPEELEAASVEDTNYLSYALNKGLNPRELDKEGACYNKRQRILVAFKPEAKKRDSRLFYMANPKFRVMLSTLEDNIGRECEKMVGMMITKDPIAVAKQLTNMARYNIDPQNVGLKPFYISFDMSKWSPHMPWEVQEMYMKIFAIWFDTNSILELAEAMKTLVVVQNRFGLSQNYSVEGTNFEGFNAKMLTKYHVDVMFLALNMCRQHKVTMEPVKFAAFIDDGVGCLLLKERDYHEKSKQAFAIIELVYEACGLEISYDKTYLSSTLMVMLGEVFYRGKRVTPGLKAFLKIGPDELSPAMTLPEKIDSIFATAQGSLKAGCLSLLAYCAYLWIGVACAIRYIKGIQLKPRQWAIWWVMPGEKGGLNGKPFNCFDNTIYRSTELEQMNILVDMCSRYPGIAHWYITWIKEWDEYKDTVEIAKTESPYPGMVSWRMKNHLSGLMRNILFQKASDKPGVSALLETVKTDIIEEMEVVIGHERIPLMDATDLYTCYPHSMVEAFISKFSRSKTLDQFLSFKDIRMIEKRHVNDACVCADFIHSTVEAY